MTAGNEVYLVSKHLWDMMSPLERMMIEQIASELTFRIEQRQLSECIVTIRSPHSLTGITELGITYLTKPPKTA